MWYLPIYLHTFNSFLALVEEAFGNEHHPFISLFFIMWTPNYLYCLLSDGLCMVVSKLWLKANPHLCSDFLLFFCYPFYTLAMMHYCSSHQNYWLCQPTYIKYHFTAPLLHDLNIQSNLWASDESRERHYSQPIQCYIWLIHGPPSGTFHFCLVDITVKCFTQ